MMSINKTRGWQYFIARLLGDVNAVKKGKVGKRASGCKSDREGFREII